MRIVLPGILLLYCAFTDILRREIDLIPLGIFAVLGVFCLIFGRDVSYISGLLGAGIGGIMVLLSVLSQGELGLGDGVLLIVLGLYLGVERNIELLILSLFLSAICSIALLIKGGTLKREYPFVPFIFTAYAIMTAF